jgi:hypothetical protein
VKSTLVHLLFWEVTCSCFIYEFYLVRVNVLKTETGTGTGNELVEPVSMNRFFKKYIKYLNFNKKIFLR